MIEIVSETGSTNADLLARLKQGEPISEGTWLVALRQTAGRGRLGRNWQDGAGNFMGSTVIALYDNDPPPHSLSFVAALALHSTIAPMLAEKAGDLMLKWPNDLLLEGAKISGILLEREGPNIVLGIGVNLTQAPELPDRKTAALSAYLTPPSPQNFAQILAEALAEELAKWRTHGLAPTLQSWLAAAHPIGTPLQITDAGQMLCGEFGGLGEDGALCLREGGRLRTVHAGDVALKA